jgi:hypothetical protein
VKITLIQGRCDPRSFVHEDRLRGRDESPDRYRALENVMEQSRGEGIGKY